MTINNEPTIKPRTVTGIFTKYIAKTLPLAFDESMSYYECLCALLEYINQTIVPDINNTNEGLGELQGFYLDLQNYVNNYFDNLDVQEEINNKLDKMAQDGTLKTIIGQYINPYLTQFNNALEEQDATISQIKTKVNSITNGSPLVASSTAGMTDTTKVYVNTTDGKWYYYDGDSWEIGGNYQSTGLGNGTVGFENLNYSLNNDIEILEDNVLDHTVTWNSTNQENGLVNKNSTIDPASSTNHWGHVEVQVNSPRKVKIYGSMGVGNTNYPLVLFYNSTTISSANLIGTITSSNNNNQQLIDIDVPNGTLLVVVNSWAIDQKKYPGVGVYNYSSNVLNRVYTYEYVEDETGTLGTTGFNKLGQPGNVNHSLTCNVGTAKKVRVTGSGGDSIPLVCFTDQFGKYINSYMPQTNWIGVTEEFSVPDNAGKVIAQDWSNHGLKVELSNETTVTLQDVNSRLSTLESGATPSDVQFNTENWKQKLIEEQEKNDFAWKSYDKAYITFTFDDLKDDISSIIDLFVRKGIKLCLAVPPSRLTTTLTGGETGLEACQRTVSAGGEILAHDFDVITSSSTDADYYKHFYTDKKLLVDAGFDINGVILAGGTNYLTADFDKCVRYMRPYFNYSDLYGYGTGVTQYYHPRTWINANLDTNKANIKSAINNKTWLSFASHGTSEVSLKLLEDLLDYIISLNSSDVEVVTFNELHDVKGSSKLEERIKALEA